MKKSKIEPYFIIGASVLLIVAVILIYIEPYKYIWIGGIMAAPLMIYLIIDSIISYRNTHSKIMDGVESFIVLTRVDRDAKHPSATYAYYVEGSEYVESMSCDWTKVVGEKFAMTYERNNPKRHKVYLDKPLFLDGEKTLTATGEVTMLWGSVIEFKYIADGSKERKAQQLPQNFRDIYPLIRKRDKFEVEFWYDNIRRSIIHLDKPVI